MTTSLRTTSLLRVLASRRLAAVGLALLLAPGSVAVAQAQSSRARISEDLSDQIKKGNPSSTRVIFTASTERVNALAAKYGLRVTKRLKTGAVLDVPAGALASVVADADVDQLSGDHVIRSQMATTNVAIGADQAWSGNGLPGGQGVKIGRAHV